MQICRRTGTRIVRDVIRFSAYTISYILKQKMQVAKMMALRPVGGLRANHRLDRTQPCPQPTQTTMSGLSPASIVPYVW